MRLPACFASTRCCPMDVRRAMPRMHLHMLVRINVWSRCDTHLQMPFCTRNVNRDDMAYVCSCVAYYASSRV
eukprot:9371906-Lingulodinium_polyedra.AAC.1